MRLDAHNAQHFTIDGGTVGKLFPPHPRGEQSVAIVTLDGHYPESGVAVNDVCTETIVVIRGTLTVHADGVAHTLTPEEGFVILPGVRYSLSGNGQAVVCITPTWDSAQNHITPNTSL